MPIARRFPDDDLPEGAVVDGETLASSRGESFDVVVVGSGAAGAVAAHVLASAGLDVGIVEEGPWIKTRDVKSDVYSTFGRAMRQSGMQVLQGRAYMPMLQGRCVGGSTLVNSAIAWRAPEDVIDDWGGALRSRWRDLHTRPRPSLCRARDGPVRPRGRSRGDGRENRLFIEQAQKLGFEAAPMRRYDRGCTGSGMCVTACPTAAKQGMSVTYVPWALRLGRARIFTSCRVEHVEIRGGARGRRRRSLGDRPSRDAARTPRRRHRCEHRAEPEHPPAQRCPLDRARAALPGAPGLAMGGLFDRPINMAFGATQGAESIHFRKTERFKLETISLPPELAAARVPGVGAELAERLSQLGHVAIWAAQVRAEAEGTVREGWGGVDRVRSR